MMCFTFSYQDSCELTAQKVSSITQFYVYYAFEVQGQLLGAESLVSGYHGLGTAGIKAFRIKEAQDLINYYPTVPPPC